MKKKNNFFKEIQKINLKNSKISAFGSTKKAGNSVETDPHILALLQAETPVVTIVGKSSTKHVIEVLKSNLENNLKMIGESVSFLKKQNKEVIYDAEHFFDGYLHNPTYALKTINTAHQAGADTIVLCDTNGGCSHQLFVEVLKKINEIKNISLGVHLHNDTGIAVSNSLIALDYGVKQIQGTMNGWGERCGNANLCTIIPNIHFKTNKKIFDEEFIKLLTPVSRYIAEIANIIPDERQPYVGLSAFAHKAGQHADVIIKNAKLMEHINGELVGNKRRILISELAGKSTIMYKMNKFGNFKKESKEIATIATILKQKEKEGYEYESAEGSFELLIRKVIKQHKPLFEFVNYQVNSAKTKESTIETSSKIKLKINGKIYQGKGTEIGPIASLDKALRNAIEGHYPFLRQIKLMDYKVRALNAKKATSAKVRVFIRSTDGETYWGSVGISENIIEASWQALVDSLEFVYNNLKN